MEAAWQQQQVVGGSAPQMGMQQQQQIGMPQQQMQMQQQMQIQQQMQMQQMMMQQHMMQQPMMQQLMVQQPMVQQPMVQQPMVQQAGAQQQQQQQQQQPQKEIGIVDVHGKAIPRNAGARKWKCGNQGVAAGAAGSRAKACGAVQAWADMCVRCGAARVPDSGVPGPTVEPYMPPGAPNPCPVDGLLPGWWVVRLLGCWGALKC